VLGLLASKFPLDRNAGAIHTAAPSPSFLWLHDHAVTVQSVVHRVSTATPR
jgi:hypothetical protein